MNNDLYLTILVSVVSVGCFVGFQLLVNKYSKDLTQSIENNPENFLKLINSKIVIFLFDSFARESMVLNYKMKHKSKADVRQQIFEMDKMKLSKNQRNALYRTALQYFIQTNNEKDASKIQRRYNEFVDNNKLNQEMKKEFEMEMRIYFKKSISTLNYINERIELSKKGSEYTWYLKKAYVLKENNRLKEAKQCIQYIIENSKDENQIKVMKELLDNDLKTL